MKDCAMAREGFRRALDTAATRPSGDAFRQLGEKAGVLVSSAGIPLSVLADTRGCIITFHEFMQGIKAIHGREVPLVDGTGTICPDDILATWEDSVRAAFVCGPGAFARLALSLARLLSIFPRDERLAGRWRYVDDVPAGRMLHSFSTEVSPGRLGEVLSARELATLAGLCCWVEERPRAPHSFNGLAATVLASLDPPASRGQEVLDDLTAGNGVARLVGVGVPLLDLSGAPRATRRQRLVEWLHGRHPGGGPRAVHAHTEATARHAREWASLLATGEALATHSLEAVHA